MKRLLTILFWGLCHAAIVSADEYKMPVLRIYFQGVIAPDMEYTNGSMHLTDTDGAVVELPAKFRTRGATSKQYMMKPSLNMKLRTADYTEEQDSALLGMRSCSSWILDAMAIDRICMRNRVAFDIWNEFSRLPYATDYDGRNGTEGRFLELFINDTYYGIYCLNDRINRKLLNLKKAQEQEDETVRVRGVLYKSGTNDITNQNEPCYNEDSSACVVEWHNAWELSYPEEYGGKTTWQPLQDAILNGLSSEYVKKYFFLENLADYQIHVMALCIGDNMGNKNHFFSIRNINKNIDDPDPNESDRRRIVITPWDLDTSMGGNFRGEYYNGTYKEWPVNEVARNAFYPLSVIQGDNEYMAILKKRWIEGRTGAFSIESVNKKLEAYRDLLIQSGAWQRMVDHFESQKAKPCYVLDLAKEIAYIEVWYAQRFQEVDDFFGITDGIVSPSAQSKESAIYDLQGRRLQKLPNKKGLYIRDGRIITPSQFYNSQFIF